MNDDQYKYDEDNAVDFIRKTLPAAVNERYDNDEILYVIDCIWDSYKRNGMLELNADITDDEALDVAALTAYVRKEIANDKEMLMDPADVDLIVKGELQYEQTLEDFQ